MKPNPGRYEQRVSTLLFAVASALESRAWRTKRWTVQETTMRDSDGTGVRLTCPRGHAYWGRSLRSAEHAVCEEKTDCPACSNARTLILFS